MSHPLISRSSDLQRLEDEGYEIEVRGGYLLLKGVPYVAENLAIRYGTLVSTLDVAGDATRQPDAHTIWWIGAMPHGEAGQELRLKAGGQEALGYGLEADFMFSRKPISGRYHDYYHKMTTYEGFISRHARGIDENVTARTFTVVEPQDDDSPFNYVDAASHRARIVSAAERLATGPVAIVGLGGTGSYILDLVAKTPVKEIHLYDGDRLGQHNAFRSPGAPSIETLREAPEKSEYFRDVYSAMHRRMFAHGRVDESNIASLGAMAFVFVAIDSGSSRKLITDKLTEFGVPFIDVGMGIELRDSSLFGVLRVTLSSGGSQGQMNSRLPVQDRDAADLYSTNVQVADLNAMNAVLAVIKWKKFLGFYADRGHEHSIYYQIPYNSLANEDSFDAPD